MSERTIIDWLLIEEYFSHMKAVIFHFLLILLYFFMDSFFHILKITNMNLLINQ